MPSARRRQPHRMPAAEADVSPGLVRRLLAAQQPDLAQLPIEVMANGWDNLMCRLGDQLAVRLPRRAMAARLLGHEQRCCRCWRSAHFSERRCDR